MAAWDVSEVSRRLSQVPLFEGLPADVLARIVRLGHSKHTAAGELFFNEGDRAEEFFVLTSGRVKLTHLTPRLRTICPNRRLVL